MKTLIECHPEISNSWNFEKNGNLTPKDVSFASAKKVWWKCEKGHEWESRVFSRTKNKSGCPVCCGKKTDKTSNLLVLYPSIAAEWHPNKNDVKIEDVVVGSGKVYWWKCNKGHEWKTSVRHRTKNETGCPYCCNQKVDDENCLGKLYPELASQWHLSNKITPYDIGRYSHKIVSWKCSVADDHIWEASVINRCFKNNGCPCCAGRKVVNSNCLQTTHPQIASEWHYGKNKRLNPLTVNAQSNEYAWFQCKDNKDHIWRTKIYVRTKGCGCPFCSSSVGETKIETVLNSMNVKYKRQYKNENCKHKRILPFDFAVFKDEKVFLIEFQGRHHYEAINYFGGEKSHKEVLIRDQVKEKYCKENKIPFLVIPHWKIDKINEMINDLLDLVY